MLCCYRRSRCLILIYFVTYFYVNRLSHLNVWVLGVRFSASTVERCPPVVLKHILENINKRSWNYTKLCSSVLISAHRLAEIGLTVCSLLYYLGVSHYLSANSVGICLVVAINPCDPSLHHHAHWRCKVCVNLSDSVKVITVRSAIGSCECSNFRHITYLWIVCRIKEVGRCCRKQIIRCIVG